MSAALSALFGGEIKPKLLQALFFGPHKTYHLRGLANEVGSNAGNVSRALPALLETHLVKVVHDARGAQYQADESSPLYQPLRQLLLADSALVNDLKAVAEELPVEDAFVFGSVARGTDGRDSDVDVLVIGDISSVKAMAAFRPVARKHAREINVMAVSRKEMEQRTAQGAEFWKDVWQNRRIPLKGSADVPEVGKRNQPGQ